MKKSSLFGWLAVTGLVLAACQPAATPTAAPGGQTSPTQAPQSGLPDLAGREVTVAIENAYLPFNYILLETGEPGDWDYDFLAEACRRLNCVPDFVQFAWDPMIQAVADGQFDMAADGITIKPERAEVVDFSDPYVTLVQRLLKRIDDDRFADEQEFAANPELVIGTQLGTTNYDAAVALVGEDRVIAFDTFPLAVQAVRAGDVDAVAIDDVAGLGYQGEYSDELELVGTISSQEELGFIFPKGSDLVAAFNAVLAQMKADGSLQELNARWFGPSFSVTYEDIGPGAYAEEEVVYGTDENPIQWVFVPSGELERVTAGAESVADLLFEQTGLVFETFVATDYTAAIEAMCATPPQAQMSSLATFALITAADRGCIEPELVSVRRGSTTYNGQIIFNVDSGIVPGDYTTLAGKTFCGVDETSTSGWIIPNVMLKANGIDPDVDLQVTFAGSHDAVATAVYNGDCDAGATFVDARTTIEATSPDVMDKVGVFEVSIPIPNDGVQYAVDFPRELRDQINEALLAIAATEAGAEALNTAYQWSGLELHDNSFYDPFRQLLDAAGVSAADL
jgi:phosphate/phosphite/phosphonate ABC transporter binding protein